MDREWLFSASITGTMDIRSETTIPIESSDIDRLSEAGFLNMDTDPHCLYPAPFTW